MPVFPVGTIFETVGGQFGLNVFSDGIDDTCNGVVIAGDYSMRQWWTQERDLYNFQVLDKVSAVDGTPFITLQRRLVNADLVIDALVQQSECIPPDAQSPAITYTRIDPMTLPREIEVQYSDPARDYAITTQNGRHHAASVHHGKISLTTTFVISADQARALAFDLLYRLWDQQLSISFEHPNINYEPGDILEVTGNQGTHVVLVQESVITENRTNKVDATVLLTAKGGTGAFNINGAIPSGSKTPPQDTLASVIFTG